MPVRPAEIVPLCGGNEQLLEEKSRVSDQHLPGDAAERHDIRRLLEAKIDSLPDTLRMIFVLRTFGEFSVQETAAALGIPEGTVRTSFFGARTQLREALSKEIDLAFDDAFAFSGERCDRIIARVMARLAADEDDSR